MRVGRPAFQTLLLLAAALVAAGVAGCGRGPATAQVSGKVRLNDGSAPQAPLQFVRFEPTEESSAEVRKGATGQISKADGSFELYTRRPGDGVYFGDYDVTFLARTAARGGKSLLAEQYANSSTTPYHVTIDGDVDDLVFDIELLPQ